MEEKGRGQRWNEKNRRMKEEKEEEEELFRTSLSMGKNFIK